MSETRTTRIVPADHPLIVEAVEALGAAIQETTPDQIPAVIDVWRELVDSMNATFLPSPEDRDYRAGLRREDFLAIATRVVARHGRDDGGRILSDAAGVLQWSCEQSKRWEEVDFTPVVA